MTCLFLSFVGKKCRSWNGCCSAENRMVQLICTRNEHIDQERGKYRCRMELLQIGYGI